jgi:hypothetical protein
MPTAHDIRAWARENGYQVEDRGNIPKDVRTAYDTANPGPNGSGNTAVATGPDYPDDEFATAFGEPPDDDALFDESALDGAPGETAETRPRRPKSRTRASSAAPAGKQRFWQRGKPEAGKAKKRPRVSTEDMLGSLWRGMAKLAAPLPPLQRTLRIQAPVAGLLLEDSVRGTALDTFLQPLARLAGQGKVISALLGPPVIVTALMFHVKQRADAQLPPSELFLTVGTEALRSSLMTWMEVAGPKFEIAIRREKEFEEKYGQSVDELIAFLLGPPPATDADVAAEEEAIRRAQGIVVDA